MRELTEERRRRLPGYALYYIDSLERERDDLRHELEQRKGVKTNVWQRPSVIHGIPDLPLLPDAEIRYALGEIHEEGESFRRQQYLDVRHQYRDRSTIEVRGARPLILRTHASNVLHLTIDER